MTTNNEAFKAYLNKFKHVTGGLRVYSELNEHEKSIAKEAWQAATTEANKRMAELESEVAELNQSIEKLVEVIAAGADLNVSYRKTIDAYEKAHKAALEEKTQARHDEALAYKHYHELQNSNNTLCQALESCKSALVEVYNDDSVPKDLREIADESYELSKEALSAKPAESLQAFENEVIEKCAEICYDSYREIDDLHDLSLADSIMALKQK